MNWCKENGYDLFNDGLKIYTTLDSRLQKYAETAVTEEMSRLQALFEVHWEDKNPWIDENNQEIEKLENKYLNKFYHFLKSIEDEMMAGFQTKEKINKAPNNHGQKKKNICLHPPLENWQILILLWW